MMNYFKKRCLPLTLLLAVFVLVPQTTHAGIFSISGLAFDLVGELLSPVAVGIVKLVSYITMLSGVVLNASIYYTVINMADSLSKANLPALNMTWTTVRDLANMGFIFMLLYASIMTIIGKEKNAREIVVKMIMAAILINFSLFFTKVIIDAANLLALTFYDALAPGAGADFLSKGLSNVIIQALGAQTLWQSAGALSGPTVFIAAILSSITLFVTAFIFAAMAVMFLVRYVVLIFVLILSPLMVLASVFPALKDYSKKWWDALLNQAFFAPIFFILMWITLTLVKEISAKTFAPSGSSIASSFNASSFNVGGVSMMINYAVILGFLIATFVISKEYANKAGSMVSGINKWALGKAGGATFGLAGSVGRRTLGAGGAAIADSERLKQAEEAGGLKGAAARLALAAGRKTGKASFDARASGLYEQISERTGTSFGKAGGKGGFDQIVKDTAKREQAEAELLKPSDLVIQKAEKELDAIKKTGTADEIKTAQDEVDRLKGVSEEEAKNRKVKDMIANEGFQTAKDARKELEKRENARIKEVARLMREENKNQKEAEEIVDADGSGRFWKPDKVESAGNKRMKTYADRLENPNLSDFGFVKDSKKLNQVWLVGKPNKQAAMEIRKKLKEKKPADKLAEELSRAKDEGGGDSTSAPTPPAGGAGPAPTTPTP